MKRQTIILVIILVFETLLCQSLFAQWSYLGLGGKTIEILRTHDGFLYAGTDNGVFRKRIDSSDTTWVSLGLESKQIQALLVLDDSTFIASILFSWILADTISLYKSINAGARWFPYQNGFGFSADGMNDYRQVWSLDMVQSHPEVMFAVGGAIAKSTDGGQSWRRVYGDHWSCYDFTYVKINPNRPNVIWANGQDFIGYSHLIKSTTSGESWQLMHSLYNSGCSIAFDPSDSNIVYVGGKYYVYKTSDGGENWFPVLSSFNPYRAFMGLALSRDSLLYASGTTSSLSTLLFYRSSDCGISWDTLAHDSIQTLGVKQLLVIEDSDIDNIFLGTWGDGVFRYVNVITAVDDASDFIIPGAFKLKQNYPNPFNAETIIRFNVARPSSVKIEVFNMLGRIVRTILDTHLTPGQYSVNFTPGNLPSGIYFYRLQTDGFVDTKKFVLVR